MTIELTCDGCGELYETTPYERDRTESNYCSIECYQETRNDKVEISCDYCGNSLVKYPSDVKKFTFCDKECRAEYRSENWTGENAPNYSGGKVQATCDLCGSVYQDYPSRVERTEGSYCSLECVYKDTRKESYHSTMEQARRSGKWKRVREEVIERDRKRCQECSHDDNLHVHHIDPVSEGGEPFDKDNLVTLCQTCHLRGYHGKND